LPIRNALPARYWPPFRATSELLLDLLRAIKVMFCQEASGPAGEVGNQAGDHRRELGIVMLQFAVHHVQLVGQ
jgi:hypothetical protein